MKLSCESAGDSMKTMLSWIACGLYLDHENDSHNIKLLQRAKEHCEEQVDAEDV